MKRDSRSRPESLGGSRRSLNGDGLLTAQWMLQRLPGAVFLAAGNALRDEVHAIHAVGDVWIERVLRVELLPGCALDHVTVCRRVDVCKCLQKRLRMSRRDARRCPRGRAEVGPAGTSVKLVRLAVDTVEHLIRLLLMPFEGAFRPIDFNPQVVLPPVRD